jgi:hypothetical protein
MTRATDEDVIDALTETLREPGARLCDGQFFEKFVGPLYKRYGHAFVDEALREIHVDIRRRAAWKIRDLRRNAAALRRERRRS